MSALIKKFNQKCITAFSTTRRRNWTFIRWKTKKTQGELKKIVNMLNQKLDWSFTSNKTKSRKLNNIHLTALILTATSTKTKIRNTDQSSQFELRSWFTIEKTAMKTQHGLEKKSRNFQLRKKLNQKDQTKDGFTPCLKPRRRKRTFNNWTIWI